MPVGFYAGIGAVAQHVASCGQELEQERRRVGLRLGLDKADNLARYAVERFGRQWFRPWLRIRRQLRRAGLCLGRILLDPLPRRSICGV